MLLLVAPEVRQMILKGEPLQALLLKAELLHTLLEDLLRAKIRAILVVILGLLPRVWVQV